MIIDEITDRQKLTIAKGLLDYQYIMEHRDYDDPDFREVYYNFYLKARWSVMSYSANAGPYFAKLKSITGEENLMDIIKALKKEMAYHSMEFSLCSKLLHTRNSDSPIYDSKVRKYLATQEKVELWWQRNKKMHGKPAPKGMKEEDIIEHDWKALRGWYDEFLNSDRGEKWIEWFDSNFPSFKGISGVKKIDFIIIAAT